MDGAFPWPGKKRALALLFLPWCAASQAIELRGYDPARHDRFTGGFADPAWNETAWFNSRLYSGVGWSAQETENKQFALVSPIHVVCAAHFLPAPGSGIRFLGQDGNLVVRGVAQRQVVPGSSSENTDLALVTLSSPVMPAEGVTHFPYLNLAAEADYIGTSLVAFGRVRRAGRGTVASFGNHSENGIGETRVMRFNYRKNTGHPDDAYLVIGDSGSPTFAMAGGTPALVGTHTAAQETMMNHVNIDTFVPAYIPGLDTLMAPDGYRMTPAYVTPVELEAAAGTIPATLWQAAGGACRFDLENPTAGDAGNVKLALTFQPGQGPDSISAPGWIPENTGPLLWSFRRATLAAGETASATATWNTLPAVPVMAVVMEHRSDGGPLRAEVFEFPLQPGYDVWAAGLADPAKSADPDLDGVENLLEYAFGGDPADPASIAAGGSLPHLETENGLAALKFPVRTDAGPRGLSYLVEFSTTLRETSWQALPAGEITVTEAPLDPPVTGFLLRRVAHAPPGPRGFYRVRVLLAE